MTIQFCRIIWHIPYYKVRQSSFITKCDRLLLQSASGIINCNSYYKVRRDSIPLIKAYFFCSVLQIKISVLNLNDGFSISFVDFAIYRKFPANNYLLKFNKRINKKRCEIYYKRLQHWCFPVGIFCLKLIIETLEKGEKYVQS